MSAVGREATFSSALIGFSKRTETGQEQSTILLLDSKGDKQAHSDTADVY